MKHIMMDIETLSTNSNGAITTISAVQFNLESGKIGKTFEIAIKLDEQVKQGAVIDTDTVIWWMSQDDEAIKAMLRIKKVTVAKALTDFNNWILDLGKPLNDIKLWGNGVSFDNVMVRNLYKRSNIDFVLPYWCDNDVRTLVTLANINVRDYKFEGIKHNGIDDCKHQIKYCHSAYKSLK
jgi:hypothetical protein